MSMLLRDFEFKLFSQSNGPLQKPLERTFQMARRYKAKRKMIVKANVPKLNHVRACLKFSECEKRAKYTLDLEKS